MAIHSSAVIDRRAELDSSVEVGPYAIIDGPVRIGARTRVWAQAFVAGWTQIGERCEIHPFAVVGHVPQDFHHGGERSYLRIGNGVIIREGATVHRGTQPESTTVIGDECFLLAQSHVGHNCELGRGVKVYNYTAVSGHVVVGDNAILSGGAKIHQFVRIGELAFIVANARVAMDVPPFMMCYRESEIIRHNVIGMRRAGYDREAVQEIRQAYRTLYRSGVLFPKAVERLAGEVHTNAGQRLLEFLRSPSKRGFCGGWSAEPGPGASADEP